MRVSSELGRNRSLISPKLFVLAFEGAVSEACYFEGVRRFADVLGIDTRSVRIEIVRRSFGFEEGHSNPLRALEHFM